LVGLPEKPGLGFLTKRKRPDSTVVDKLIKSYKDGQFTKDILSMKVALSSCWRENVPTTPSPFAEFEQQTGLFKAVTFLAGICSFHQEDLFKRTTFSKETKFSKKLRANFIVGFVMRVQVVFEQKRFEKKCLKFIENLKVARVVNAILKNGSEYSNLPTKVSVSRESCNFLFDLTGFPGLEQD
jgi:hypothetical protein